MKPCDHGVVGKGSPSTHTHTHIISIPFPLGKFSPCPETMAKTPNCSNTCESGYPVSYSKDKHFGASAYSIPKNVMAIQSEIMTNGPVEAIFRVYGDFMSYKSGALTNSNHSCCTYSNSVPDSVGVYKHLDGDALGIHAIRILGWGTEDSTPYWLVANSWNTDWGDSGEETMHA